MNASPATTSPATNSAATPVNARDSDAEYYAQHGYVVVRKLISQDKIQRLLRLYAEQLVTSRYPFFRQNANAYEPNKVSAHGFVRQPMPQRLGHTVIEQDAAHTAVTSANA